MQEPGNKGPDGETEAFASGSGAQTGQLDLGDDEASLPWLEGDEEDEEEYAGYNTGQLVGLVLAGLLVIGLVVGGIWWASDRPNDAELVAEGGVIEAPEGPYKEKPKDPGGMTFEGTGDTSFAVSEGQTRPAKLEAQTTGPAPGFTALDKDKPVAKPSASASESAPELKGPGVQVGAYSTRTSAEAGWTKLQQQYEALSGLRYRIVEGQADIGTVYRLQALAEDAAAARSLCSRLKASGLNCQVKN